MTRNEKMREIDLKDAGCVELTETEKEIISKRDRYAMDMAMFRIHQLGDPQELENEFAELCSMLDKEIANG